VYPPANYIRLIRFSATITISNKLLEPNYFRFREVFVSLDKRFRLIAALQQTLPGACKTWPSWCTLLPHPFTTGSRTGTRRYYSSMDD